MKSLQQSQTDTKNDEENIIGAYPPFLPSLPLKQKKKRQRRRKATNIC